MIDLKTFNDPAFKARLTYFQTETFLARLDRLARRLRRGERPDDRGFWNALGCSETELVAWLTIKDAVDLHCGREPRHGFPALRGRGTVTVDVKLTPNGDLIDYRFLEWACEPANPKETLQ